MIIIGMKRLYAPAILFILFIADHGKIMLVIIIATLVVLALIIWFLVVRGKKKIGIDPNE